MTSLLPQFYLLLKAVTEIKDKRCQTQILKRLARNKEFCACVREIARNVANLDLSRKDKKRLDRQATLVRDLAKARRVPQSGGFLNIVVPLLATIVGELIASKIKT